MTDQGRAAKLEDIEQRAKAWASARTALDIAELLDSEVSEEELELLITVKFDTANALMAAVGALDAGTRGDMAE